MCHVGTRLEVRGSPDAFFSFTYNDNKSGKKKSGYNVQGREPRDSNFGSDNTPLSQAQALSETEPDV